MSTFTTEPETPDATLVQRSQSGEKEAFGALVKRHHNAACSVAFGVCGDLAASEDIAQEAFLSAWKQLAQIREKSQFRPWICGIARKIALNQIRRGQRRDEIVADQTRDEASPYTKAPNQEAIATEEAALLWNALNKLPETYREPLILFYREQKSIGAVATALDLSETAVKKRLSRGRTLLREQLLKRIEITLDETRPGPGFVAGVINLLPPLAVAVGASTTVTTAKASATASGALAKAKLAATFSPASLLANCATGLFGLYLFFRHTFSPNISQRERNLLITTSSFSLASALAFAVFIAWIAQDRGETLQGLGLSLFAIVAIAILHFALSQALIAFRARKVLLPLAAFQKSRRIPPYRFTSKRCFLGMPFIDIAFGTGPAKAWVAVGDIAIGGIAIGGIAIGTVSIGGASLGALALGGSCLGFLATGGFAIGYVSFAGIALAWDLAIGGVAVAHELAIGYLAIAVKEADGLVSIANSVPMKSHWLDLAKASLPHLGLLSLLSMPALWISYRYIGRAK